MQLPTYIFEKKIIFQRFIGEYTLMFTVIYYGAYIIIVIIDVYINLINPHVYRMY